MEESEVKLTMLSEIQAEEVKWLWYPYIPIGKITIVQGDPGEGKTTLVLAVAALLTRGGPMPESGAQCEPFTVIYQTAEDGIADTIKPRLVAVGADCARVAVIDESSQPLSFGDDRLERAIRQVGAKMLILDPLQAYLGGTVDMHRANEIRPLFARLGAVAERTGCAVVIIGHMNKMSGAKGIQRGLGSMDIPAVARSILLVGRDRDNPNVRIMAHLKSSLAAEGRSIAFSLDENMGFRWIGYYDISAEELLNGGRTADGWQTKQSRAEQLLTVLLTEGDKSCSDIYAALDAEQIGRRTAENAKKAIGAVSYKLGACWYWTLAQGNNATLQ